MGADGACCPLTRTDARNQISPICGRSSIVTAQASLMSIILRDRSTLLPNKIKQDHRRATNPFLLRPEQRRRHCIELIHTVTCRLSTPRAKGGCRFERRSFERTLRYSCRFQGLNVTPFTSGCQRLKFGVADGRYDPTV